MLLGYSFDKHILPMIPLNEPCRISKQNHSAYRWQPSRTLFFWISIVEIINLLDIDFFQKTLLVYITYLEVYNKYLLPGTFKKMVYHRHNVYSPLSLMHNLLAVF